MDLIDRHRHISRVDLVRCWRGMRESHFVKYDRCRAWPHFRGEREWIGLQWEPIAVAVSYRKLVMITDACTRNEQLPIASVADPHRVTARIPKIEIADNRNMQRIRRKHHKS